MQTKNSPALYTFFHWEKLLESYTFHLLLFVRAEVLPIHDKLVSYSERIISLLLQFDLVNTHSSSSRSHQLRFFLSHYKYVAVSKEMKQLKRMDDMGWMCINHL